MTYDTYLYIFYGGIGASIVFFLTSVLLFFVLKVPAIFGDLSGSTAKKEIARIQQGNRSSSHTGRKSSKLTSNHSRKNTASMNRTEKMATGDIGKPAVYANMNISKGNTEDLEAPQPAMSVETTVLSETPSIGDTTTLSHSGYTAQTTVLSEVTSKPITSSLDNSQFVFTIVYELSYTAADHIIE